MTMTTTAGPTARAPGRRIPALFTTALVTSAVAVAWLMMKTLDALRLSLSLNARPLSSRDWNVSK